MNYELRDIESRCDSLDIRIIKLVKTKVHKMKENCFTKGCCLLHAIYEEMRENL